MLVATLVTVDVTQTPVSTSCTGRPSDHATTRKDVVRAPTLLTGLWGDHLQRRRFEHSACKHADLAKGGLHSCYGLHHTVDFTIDSAMALYCSLYMTVQ